MLVLFLGQQALWVCLKYTYLVLLLHQQIVLAKKEVIWKKNLVLGFLVVVLAIAPLVFVNGEYSGADGEAEGLITEMNKEYSPWFESLWEPPSGEIESLLFALQAAIGTGIICYYIGYQIGKSKKNEEKE